MKPIKKIVLLFALLIVARVSNAGAVNYAIVTNNYNVGEVITKQVDDNIDEEGNAHPIYPVNWENIREFVKNNTDSVKVLVNRMLSVEDTKLTDEETMLTFFGQSFISDGEEEPFLYKLDKSLKHNNFLEVNKFVDEALKINPLNIEARYWKYVILFGAKDNPDISSLYSEAEIEHQENITVRMLTAIYLSGYGSQEAPFYVTSVSDEYMFMTKFLNIQRKDLGIQEVTTINNRPYDYFVVKNKNENFKHDKIYFDITRVYETEKKMFKVK